ncbi:hypothetical protein EOD39_10888 [Acipenser ruthenus]|uniref:HECT domain-containing protein n=1 Tax=Acipenser ruthenus TaxID=7906 RepID=A0A662YT18_ACIRT|nr:hypothetical protein EOD39_10888 [Acipenser ruthenus]
MGYVNFYDNSTSMALIRCITGFITRSQHELKNLIKFWIGWEMLPKSLQIKDDVDFPVASTCFETLKIPSKYRTYESFREELVAISSSSNAGFGQV